jgi:diguanylate cyclase
MTIPHEPWLVLLSIAIAIQGSFVGLSLAAEIDTATGSRRRLVLAGSAVTLATGVWSMHFVGLLAASFPSAIDYLVTPTLTSFLICVIVVGLGVYAVHATRLPRLRIALGAIAMGLGISTMHYVGMSAVHLAGPTYQEPRFVVASILVSIAASAFALLALGSRPNRLRLFAGAVVLGLAISGMHYTAMAGMRLDPLCFDVSRFVGAESALSRNTLALLATVISFGVSGAFLLSLVPDSQPRTPRLMIGPEALAPAAGPAIPIAVADIGSGATPTPVARAVPTPPIANIRVEKDGRARFLAVDDIYAVRANAHYTFIHDGEREYFCNQSISALEAELEESEFVRVHRSYIVRLARVSRIRRSGEAAVAELGQPVRCAIPVARGQYREIKARIETLQRSERPPAREKSQSD